MVVMVVELGCGDSGGDGISGVSSGGGGGGGVVV